jgi:Glycosyl transferase family 2
MSKLTIGMAQFDDWDGVYFSVQSLRLHHPEVMKDTEILVIDNSPHLPVSQTLQAFINSGITEGTAGVRYIPMSEPTGTSPPRNRVFQEAKGDAVLCMDSHVLLPPGSLKRLIKWYDDHPGTQDLYQGPMYLDHLQHTCTHFNDQWRAEMWGTWGAAWRCSCDPVQDQVFTMIQTPMSGVDYARPAYLEMGHKLITECGRCHKLIPQGLGWSGHEAQLESAGFVRLGIGSDETPFEITGQGLGLFTCRKDAWLGFNQDAREFGGEEMWIHEKFRKKGHKAICLPFLKWVHRFGRPRGTPYILSRYGKIRNYVLEFDELGMDKAPIFNHFVGQGLFTMPQWQALISDPIGRVTEGGPAQPQQGCGSCGQQAQQSLTFANLDNVFDKIRQIPRDLNQHMEKFKELSSKVGHVTEFSDRKESMIGFLAGRPKKFISHNSENEAVVRITTEFAKQEGLDFEHIPNSSTNGEIEETDLLFLDTRHDFQFVLEHLNKYHSKVKRFIVLHDTAIFGEKFNDGPGILPALRLFMGKNRQWTIVHHTMDQYGLTVLGCDPQDKPKPPGIVKQSITFAKAMSKYVASGMENVSPEELQARLEICEVCPGGQRIVNLNGHDQCAACGCLLVEDRGPGIPGKAKMATETCPLFYWKLTEQQQKALDEVKS